MESVVLYMHEWMTEDEINNSPTILFGGSKVKEHEEEFWKFLFKFLNSSFRTFDFFFWEIFWKPPLLFKYFIICLLISFLNIWKFIIFNFWIFLSFFWNYSFEFLKTPFFLTLKTSIYILFPSLLNNFYCKYFLF